MKDLTLLIMAAGMGTRYGGLKQLDEFGPNGETIMDYSVFDAIRSGYKKVVFIIRKEFEEEFRKKITDKYEDLIHVECVFQDLNSLPDEFECPEGREKPWGTGHAILSASDCIDGPFSVINADDFYSQDSFQKIANYYNDGNDSFSLVAFRLDQTLSSFGGVTRGVCSTENGFLSTVVETGNVQKSKDGVTSDSEVSLDGSEPVSVNMWGFTPVLFDHLREMFINFLQEEGNELKSEFLIPTVINELIQSGKEQVRVLTSDSPWFGVTYKDDKEFVTGEIRRLIAKGEYAQKLF